MQAYLQYRRIGQAVRKRLDNREIGHAGIGDSLKSAENTSIDGNVTQKERSGVLGLKVMHGDRTQGREDSVVFLVGWDDELDPLNPRNYSTAQRILATLIVSSSKLVIAE